MTPGERMFRRMGFFDDQSGIIRRYQREREYWDKHLQQTRKFAIGSMKGKGHGKAAVLGSGWLLDVPLEELSSSFAKVCLYDIRHPAAVKKQAKAAGNVELQTCDISCFARNVYQYVKKYGNSKVRPPINTIEPEPVLDLNEFDFIFSCNIFNQLDILLIDYLAQSFELSSEETMAFRTNIQQHHIGLLPTGRSCIVADYEEMTYSQSGKEISRKTSVFHPIVQQPGNQQWIWEFDTKMTYYEDRKTFFKVFGAKI